MDINIRVGILAFQGAFAEHEFCLKKAAEIVNDGGEVDLIQVKNTSDLDGLDGLVIPGGESTTMAHYLKRNGFIDALSTWRQGESATLITVLLN